MHWSLVNIWNCASGPVRRLTPAARIVVASLVFVACIVSQPTRLLGLACLMVTTLGWLIICRPPAWLLRSVLWLGFVMLLPIFLLGPFAESKGHFLQGLSVPWTLFARGLVGMLVSVSAMAAMTPGELQEGLRALKVPALVVTLVVQIIHQMGLLIEETRRISAALALRRTSESTAGAWRILRAMPRVWLPRVIHRAERLAMTMELRGYGIDMPCPRIATFHWRDAISITLAVSWLLLVILVQHRTARS